MNRYLLDSHVLLWWAKDPSLISEAARIAIQNPHNVIYFSMASAWEISIKQKIGKLQVPTPVEEILRRSQFLPLNIHFDHLNILQTLPAIHGDPFDRIMIAQALKDGLTLITRDRDILRYDVPTIAA
jgi:PIN domain nuclease of toxin-antitoxin system